jgi:lactate dehydrogenase-like 2-hydroxyacid dehydrogenase
MEPALSKVEIVTLDSFTPNTRKSLEGLFRLHSGGHGEPVPDSVAANIRGIARGGHTPVNRAFLESLPKLEIVGNFGVGYDGIDLKYAAERGIVVTNTPEVLTEEVADTALGLLLMTVRELSAAERHLRAGKWATEGPWRLSPSLRGRTVGIVGLGRIGKAIARRLDAMKIPVVYYGRHEQKDVPYRYYADLRAMAEAVDVLLVVIPGNASTANLIDATVLKALGPVGILINIGRGIVVDEAALAEALKNGTILSAGLDVFAREPHVPQALIDLPNAVLLPHVGSASLHTRDAMGQLMVDNLKSWFETGKPITPVPETPVPSRK